MNQLKNAHVELKSPIVCNNSKKYKISACTSVYQRKLDLYSNLGKTKDIAIAALSVWIMHLTGWIVVDTLLQDIVVSIAWIGIVLCILKNVDDIVKQLLGE